MSDTRKERHGSVKVADPDLVGAGVEIEGAFLVKLGWCVRRRKDFDADLGCASEKGRVLLILRMARAEPGDIDGFDAVGSGDRAFGERGTLWQEALQERGNTSLAAGMTRSGRWTHDDVSVSIGFDPIGEFAQARIGQDFAPPGNVKRGLSLKIWKLDGDGHSGNLH
jgi:hypothetical protein